MSTVRLSGQQNVQRSIDDLRTEANFLRIKADYVRFIDTLYRKFPVPELLRLRDIINQSKTIDELIANVEQYQREIIDKFKELLPAFQDRLIEQQSKMAAYFNLDYQSIGLTKEAAVPVGLAVLHFLGWTIAAVLGAAIVQSSIQRIQEGPARHNVRETIQIPGLGQIEIKPETELFPYMKDFRRTTETVFSIFNAEPIRKEIAQTAVADVKQQMRKLNENLKRKFLEDLKQKFDIQDEELQNLEQSISLWINNYIAGPIDYRAESIKHTTSAQARLDSLRSLISDYKTRVGTAQKAFNSFINELLAFDENLRFVPNRAAIINQLFDHYFITRRAADIYDVYSTSSAEQSSLDMETLSLPILPQTPIVEQAPKRQPAVESVQQAETYTSPPYSQSSQSSRLSWPISPRTTTKPSSAPAQTRTEFKPTPTQSTTTPWTPSTADATRSSQSAIGVPTSQPTSKFPFRRTELMDTVSDALTSVLGEIKTPDLSESSK